MNLIYIMITLFSTLSNQEMPKPKLIYVGDPMCSWCYGISSELTRTIDYYGDDIELELIMGGLRSGGGDTWDSKFTEFLKHHWEDVGMKSGLPFKFDLLDWDHFDYNTEPSCRSVVAVLNIDKNKALPFFKAVQTGFYVENKDPKQTSFYKPICESLGIDFSEFSSKFESEEYKSKTIQHFQKSQQIGVRSFPTLLIEHNGQLHLVTSGFSTFAQMKSKIDGVLER